MLIFGGAYFRNFTVCVDKQEQKGNKVNTPIRLITKCESKHVLTKYSVKTSANKNTPVS